MGSPCYANSAASTASDRDLSIPVSPETSHTGLQASLPSWPVAGG